MGKMNKSAEEFVQSVQCIENAVHIGHVNTSLALDVLKNLSESKSTSLPYVCLC